MLRFFDNIYGVVCCIILKPMLLEREDAESFIAIDQNFTPDGALCYTNLVGLSSDSANLMQGTQCSILVQLKI